MITLITVIFGLLIRAAFYADIAGLNNKFSQENKQVESWIIWMAFFPILYFLAFPYSVTKVSTGLSFELQSRGINETRENPTKGAGLALYICSLMTLLFSLWSSVDGNENVIILAFPFALASLVLVIVYWIRINKYKRLLDKSVPTFIHETED